MNTLAQLAYKRSAWLILGFSALALELAALYFQYAMGLEPCIKCIYQRAAVFGVMVAAFTAALAPNWLLMRLAGFAGALVSSVWGLKIAIEHVDSQTTTDIFSMVPCGFRAEFPSWLPLDQWLPSVFEVTGTCDTIDWVFLKLSMPEWMAVIFASWTLVLSMVLLCRIVKLRTI